MSKPSLNERQTFFSEISKTDNTSGIIKILNWNVRNPSLQRALKQIEWIRSKEFDVIVLTETKVSEGCVYIKDRLANLGYRTFLTNSNDDYGLIMAVRNLKSIPEISVRSLPHRYSFALCDFFGKDFLITGVYVPVWRNEEKKTFLKSFEETLKHHIANNEYSIIIGDMNVLEPDHNPQYSQYKNWEYFYKDFIKYGFTDAFRYFHSKEKEYSWFGRKGNGYRFDHVFISRGVLPLLRKCFYIHEPRLNKLSDHSAMHIEIKIS